MDIFRLMKVFVCVADEGSFAAAARRLSISPPVITRSVASLEEYLGVKLLHRTTRYVRPTDAGLIYLEDARRILDDVDMAAAHVTGSGAVPKGTLSVTASVLFGRMAVLPTIEKYLSENPDVSVDALFLDRTVNLLEEGVDVAVRIGHLPDSSHRAIRVGNVREVVFAAKNYLDEYGRPESPQDLKNHSLVLSRPLSPVDSWRFYDQGKVQTMRIQPRLQISSNDAVLEAVLSGGGISRLLCYQIKPYLPSGDLEILLESYEPQPLPVHILHRETRSTAKVRTFIDMLAADLRDYLLVK